MGHLSSTVSGSCGPSQAWASGRPFTFQGAMAEPLPHPQVVGRHRGGLQPALLYVTASSTWWPLGSGEGTPQVPACLDRSEKDTHRDGKERWTESGPPQGWGGAIDKECLYQGF